jgi:transcriptional regulator with XRE-family HTH domain
MVKDRIAHIMRSKNLTAAQFADQLEVQRSGISHLLSGRNKPSLDFILKLKETFPEFNLDWIILGKGPITGSARSVERNEQTLFDKATFPSKTDEAVSGSLEIEDQNTENQLPVNKKTSPETEEVVNNSLQKEIVKIILIYSDSTFEQLNPTKSD